MLTEESQASCLADRGLKRARTKALIERFRDGQWYAVCAIASSMEMELSEAQRLCCRIVCRGLFHTLGERRHAASTHGGWEYRFVKGGKKISLEAFYSEVGSMLDDMEKLIYGHSVDFSQQAMKIAYTRFRQAIDRVAR